MIADCVGCFDGSRSLDGIDESGFEIVAGGWHRRRAGAGHGWQECNAQAKGNRGGTGQHDMSLTFGRRRMRFVDGSGVNVSELRTARCPTVYRTPPTFASVIST